MTITITQINGMPIVLNMSLPGAQGVGISNVVINELNELIVTLTSGAVINAGVIIAAGGEGGTMTPGQILAAIKTVDGPASGLDADLLDGQNGTYYLSWNNATDKPSPIITLSGDATGSVTLANLASGTLPVTVTDNSHNHTIANVSGLQTAIDGKADDVHSHAVGDVTGLDTAITNNAAVAANATARHSHSNKTVLDNTTASYTTTEQTKLAGIETGATADQSASEILNSLKTVDGTGSGLDADTLDGNEGSYFASAATTYSKSEVDNAISAVVTSLDWKESVATFVDIATTYPAPIDGWTVSVKDTDTVYRYSGEGWVAISANSIPLASGVTDGKMSASDFTKLAGIEANANNYSHPLNHPPSVITQDATNRFFTDTERTKLAGIAANANNYSHPTGDGNLHVPVTGTTNNGKVLVAGSEAGSASWQTPTKSMVGLTNVDNTSDADKPISTATQAALNNKANSTDTAPDSLKINGYNFVTYDAATFAGATKDADTLYAVYEGA